jgi:hypothetical protein
MNIYRLIEDGEHCLIKAKTMAIAIKFCEESYLEEAQERERDKYNMEYEKEYYHNEILESCELIGELKN